MSDVSRLLTIITKTLMWKCSDTVYKLFLTEMLRSRDQRGLETTFLGLGLGLGLTVIGLGLGLGLMR